MTTGYYKMNPIAKNYICELKRLRQKSKDAFVFPVSDVSGGDWDTARYEKLTQHALTTYGMDHREELAKHGEDMEHWISSLEELLYQDLIDICSKTEQDILAHVAIGYLPMSHSNAFAETLVASNQNERMHAIGINLGLIWVSNLLCEALLLESVEREEDAFFMYQKALNCCVGNPTTPLKVNVGSDDDLIGLDAGAISSLILRFVGLHEFGHIVLNHTQHMEMRWDKPSEMVQYVAYDNEPELQETLMQMEFAADTFAIDHMISKTGSSEQMWNNTFFIVAFFRLLEHGEEVLGTPSCTYHPPPNTRAKNVYQQVEKAIGNPTNDALKWLDVVMKKWKIQNERHINCESFVQ